MPEGPSEEGPAISGQRATFVGALGFLALFVNVLLVLLCLLLYLTRRGRPKVRVHAFPALLCSLSSCVLFGVIFFNGIARDFQHFAPIVFANTTERNPPEHEHSGILFDGAHRQFLQPDGKEEQFQSRPQQAHGWETGFVLRPPLPRYQNHGSPWNHDNITQPLDTRVDFPQVSCSAYFVALTMWMPLFLVGVFWGQWHLRQVHRLELRKNFWASTDISSDSYPLLAKTKLHAGSKSRDGDGDGRDRGGDLVRTAPDSDANSTATSPSNLLTDDVARLAPLGRRRRQRRSGRGSRISPLQPHPAWLAEVEDLRRRLSDWRLAGRILLSLVPPATVTAILMALDFHEDTCVERPGCGGVPTDTHQTHYDCHVTFPIKMLMVGYAGLGLLGTSLLAFYPRLRLWELDRLGLRRELSLLFVYGLCCVVALVVVEMLDEDLTVENLFAVYWLPVAVWHTRVFVIGAIHTLDMCNGSSKQQQLPQYARRAAAADYALELHDNMGSSGGLREAAPRPSVSRDDGIAAGAASIGGGGGGVSDIGAAHPPPGTPSSRPPGSPSSRQTLSASRHPSAVAYSATGGGTAAFDENGLLIRGSAFWDEVAMQELLDFLLPSRRQTSGYGLMQPGNPKQRFSWFLYACQQDYSTDAPQAWKAMQDFRTCPSLTAAFNIFVKYLIPEAPMRIQGLSPALDCRIRHLFPDHRKRRRRTSSKRRLGRQQSRGAHHPADPEFRLQTQQLARFAHRGFDPRLFSFARVRSLFRDLQDHLLSWMAGREWLRFKQSPYLAKFDPASRLSHEDYPPGLKPDQPQQQQWSNALGAAQSSRSGRLQLYQLQQQHHLQLLQQQHQLQQQPRPLLWRPGRDADAGAPDHNQFQAAFATEAPATALQDFQQQPSLAPGLPSVMQHPEQAHHHQQPHPQQPPPPRLPQQQYQAPRSHQHRGSVIHDINNSSEIIIISTRR